MGLGFAILLPLTRVEQGPTEAATNMATLGNMVSGLGQRMTPSFRQSHVAEAKKGFHPEFFPEAKVWLNGKVVTKVGSTQESYNVEVWSGNHPFYQRDKDIVLEDKGAVAKFKEKFGDIFAPVSKSKGGAAATEETK